MSATSDPDTEPATGTPAASAMPGRPTSIGVRRVRRLVRGAVCAVAVLALAVGVLCLLSVATGGGWNIVVVLLAALAGWVPVLLAVALAGGAALRSRRLLTVAGAAMVVTLVWLQPFPSNVWRDPRALVGVAPAPPAGARTDVTVLALNLQFGWADTGQVLAEIRRYKPDVVVLTELTQQAANSLNRAGLATLMPHQLIEGRWFAGGTGLWSTRPLQDAHLIDETQFVAVQATITVDGRPVVVTGAHPYPPTEDGPAAWAADYAVITTAVAATGGGPGTTRIVAGDLNATTAHGPLRHLMAVGLEDAATATSWSWSDLTWPQGRRFMPPVMRIDHVLSSKDATTQSVSTFAVEGSDHRGIVARLSIPKG